MTGLVLADTAVIAGGFWSSLEQLPASPWGAVPGIVFLAMLGTLWRLRRLSRRLPLQPLPPAEVGEVIDDMLPAVFERRPEEGERDA